MKTDELAKESKNVNDVILVDNKSFSNGSVLCSNCGFCCNSVLFSEVKFQKGDAVKILISKGLKKIPAINGFSQPCSAFDGKICRVYDLRPRYCHDFVCRLLKSVISGSVPIKTAQRIVRSAIRQVESVRKLMRELGETDEMKALSCRLGDIMARPYDPSDSVQDNKLRRQLMLQSQKLMQVLEKHFL